MRYLMLVCRDESIALDADRDIMAETDAWVAEMDGRGVRDRGHVLRPVIDATTVRVRGGEVVVADGPFAEAKEVIAGFDIIDCADLDEAIEIASKHPCANLGSLELRPFWEE